MAPERFSAPITFDAGDSPGWIAAADFNGDGLVDLVGAEGGIFANPPNEVTVLLGDGSGAFTIASSLVAGDVLLPGAVADFNADGHVDVAIQFGKLLLQRLVLSCQEPVRPVNALRQAAGATGKRNHGCVFRVDSRDMLIARLSLQFLQSETSTQAEPTSTGCYGEWKLAQGGIRHA